MIINRHEDNLNISIEDRVGTMVSWEIIFMLKICENTKKSLEVISDTESFINFCVYVCIKRP